MEALPRLPMTSFELLSTSEKVSFAQKLKLYIASFYQEDPESYNNEIQTLEGLRAQAVWPSIDINSCQIMKKYYCQLHYLKSRFPMEENQIASVYFAWKDDYTKMSCSMPDINFEMMCMLINIGCIHSKLGAEDTRTSPEGMKMSCTHFQCAAWAFQTVRETYGQLIGLIMISSEQIRGMQLLCLAHAQECILEKSLLDNRKATIIAKIAMHLCDYYRQAGVAFQSGDDCLVLEHFPNHKYLAQYLQFKIAYHRCIALLYQGQQAEEQQKMGERVAFYQAAVDMLDEAVTLVGKMSRSSQGLFKDTIAFTLDVVKGKHKAALNENEFIYHEDVPQLASLQEIKGASLVKGIPFNIHDPEVAGNDIFGRLVPMEAHEASSLYSEKKAQLLRKMGEMIEKKDVELCDFLNSMQLEVLSFVKSSKGLPQELVDRAASMVARPNATRELADAMGKLSNSYQEVEGMLQEIQEMLQIEEESEKEYQKVMGKRPPSIIATDLARESAKYQEAHGKASESNLNLHKAMTTHAANIKLLAQPLGQLMQLVPTLNLPDQNVDEKILESIEGLIAKIEEMKHQRMMLWNQLRDSIHNDDITGAIITKEPDQSLEVVFQQALEKHNKITAVIEQNLVAQDNICKALVEIYAKFTPTRKYLQDLFHKRNSTLSALISSHDTYDDLIMKANKGIEFYGKLESNVSKLLGRIKSACNVQQEERDQMLVKNGHTKQHTKEEVVTSVSGGMPPQEMNNISGGVQNVTNITIQHNNLNNMQPLPSKPKLKDYLESRKNLEKNKEVLQYPASMYTPGAAPGVAGGNISALPTGIATNGVTGGQEQWVNEYSEYIPPNAGYHQHQQYNNSVVTSQYNGGGYTQVNYTDKNINKDLVSKMNALKMNTATSGGIGTSSGCGGVTPGGSPAAHYDAINAQAYGAYNNYIPTSSTTAGAGPYTAVVGATPTPAVAAGIQEYTPDAANGPNYAAYSNYPTNTTPGLTTDITASGNATNYKQYADYYGQSQPPVAAGVGGSGGTGAMSGSVAGGSDGTAGGVTQPTGNYYNYGTSAAEQSHQSGQSTDNALSYPPSPYQYYNSTVDAPNQAYTAPNYSYPTGSYPAANAYNNTSTKDYTNSNSANVSNTFGQYPYMDANTTSQPYSTDPAASAAYPYSGTSSVQPAGNTQAVQLPTPQAPPQATQGILPPSNLASYNQNLNSYGSTPTPPPSQATPTPPPQTGATPYGNYYNYQPDSSTYNPNQSLYNASNQHYNGANYPYGSTASGAGTAASTSSTPPSTSVNYGYQASTANDYGYSYNYNYTNEVYDYSAATSGANATAGYQQSTINNYQYQPNVPQSGPQSQGQAAVPTQAPIQASTQVPAQIQLVPAPKKESSIDLLAGLDFSINQAPLIPQISQTDKSKDVPNAEVIETPPKKPPSANNSATSLPVKKKDKVPLKPLTDPLRNPETVKQFLQEVDKFEKYVADLSLRTLSGPSNLELRWKEVQDVQDGMEAAKRSISVARCYPLKNRSPDILPYDHSRVALENAKDDYINASLVSVGPYCMDFVLTQLPLAHTVAEFWHMVWEQRIETIVCLLADNEINEGCYWPSEPGKDLNVTRRVILAHRSANEHWTERKLTISDEKESRLINIFQFTAWPGSLFPSNPQPFIDFLQLVIRSFEQQKCTGSPVLVHCLAGVGRTGVATTLLAALMEFAAIACPLPDAAALGAKISCARKNTLRDREHLKFVYTTLLHHFQTVRRGYIKCDNDKADETVKPVAVEVDPFRELDPLWASRKS